MTGDVRETYGAWAMISGHQRFPGRPTLPRRPLLSPTDHRRTNNKISTVTTYPQRLHCLIAIRGGAARGVSQLPTSFPPSILAPHYGQHSTLSPQLLPPSTGAASAHRPHFNTRNMLFSALSVQFTFMLPQPIPPKSILHNNFFLIPASSASIDRLISHVVLLPENPPLSLRLPVTQSFPDHRCHSPPPSPSPPLTTISTTTPNAITTTTTTTTSTHHHYHR